jgi:hypothetical protein
MPNFEPHMPEVDEVPDIADRFAVARRVTRGEETLRPDHPPEPGQRHVVLITPGRMLMQQPCPPPGSVDQSMIASIEQLAPGDKPLNITVIALNEIQAVLTDVSKAIPFFGYLLGLCYVGHNVTIFEGHSSALAAGCADADLLIADAAMIPFLQEDWLKVAFSSGTAQRLLVFYRDGRLEELLKSDEDF